jgi:hypothetical protein
MRLLIVYDWEWFLLIFIEKLDFFASSSWILKWFDDVCFSILKIKKHS